MQIDAALLQYNNRTLSVPKGGAGATHAKTNPSAAAQVQGTGARIADSKPIDKTSELYKECQEFESIFVKMMLKEMRATVDTSDSLVSGGWAEKIYQDMLDDEYAKSMAKTANFGLADQLYRQLATA
jgi:Rod binding domain-containing protein